MKLANFFLMTVLVGTLGVLGCGDDDTNTAGSGGSGTAGTGGSGTAGTGGSGEGGAGGGAASVCAACDMADQIPLCETTYDACIIDDAGTPEDCAAAGLLRCRGI